MIQESAFTLRVIWACMLRDIKSMLTDRAFTLMGILMPLNAFLLMSLFVLAGGNAPTAVVMQDTGPYAQKFYQSMSTAHSFTLQKMSASQASNLMQGGHIVALVTIPLDFDQRVQQRQPVKINVQINNLNTDFTNDIRRALPLSITSFYARAFPDVVRIVPKESDAYAQDTDYIPYLTVSIMIIGMLFGGVVNAGTSMSREWEMATMKELLLSPASRWAIVTGKMLGSFVINAVSTGIVLAVLILVIGVHPVNWGEVIGFSVLDLIIFIAWGTFLGTIFKQRKAVVVLALGVSFPLFFLSGPFGPISFSIPLIQFIAKIFPVYYAIVLQQHAFHNFNLNTYGVGINALILGGYTLVLILLAAFALRRRTVAF
jgi:ABC-type transport system involved in multi-copper enzyme maturation permease subunit